MTRIFISHSHSDEDIAFKLVNFLLATLRIEEEEILCTSNPSQGLAYSSNSIADQLKNKLKKSEALVILITIDSLNSAWVPFEAGSFWTTDKPVIPILGPGLSQQDLPGPLKNFLSIAIADPDFAEKLNNAINQVANHLAIKQKFTTRRNHILREFTALLQNWQSQRSLAQMNQERQLEALTKQVEEITSAFQAEKVQIEEFYQAQLQELEQSYQVRVEQLEQQLATETKLPLLDMKTANLALPTRVLEQDTHHQAIAREEIELKSASNVDYRKLSRLLEQHQWQLADRETNSVMLQAANCRDEHLSREDIDRFPHQDFQTINQLWLHHSQDKFGFSIQEELYARLGTTEDSELQIWSQFSELAGWKQDEYWLDYHELIFDLHLAPRGHLPTVWKSLAPENRSAFFFLLSFNSL